MNWMTENLHKYQYWCCIMNVYFNRIGHEFGVPRSTIFNLYVTVTVYFCFYANDIQQYLVVFLNIFTHLDVQS